MSTAGPPPSPWTGAPAALAIGLGFSVAGSLVLDVLTTWAQTAGDGAVARWVGTTVWLVWTALGTAVNALVLAGLIELARRTTRREALLLTIAAGAVGLLLIAPFVIAYADLWDHERLRAFMDWRALLVPAVALVGYGAVVAAGWRHATVRRAGPALVLLTILVYPCRWLYDLIQFAGYLEPGALAWLQLVVDRGLHLAWAATLLACAAAIGRGAPAAPGWHGAGAGLHRAGSALVARVLIAVIGAVMVIAAIASRSPGLLRLWTWAIPLALVVATIALVSGLLQAGGLAAAEAPRGRLCAAAALITWAATIQALQAAYAGVPDRSSRVGEIATAAPYLTPAIALAGLLCALAAAAALRARLPARAGAPSIPLAGVLAAIGSLGGVLAARWVASPGSIGTLYMAMPLLAVAAVVGQLAVARVLHRVGAAMQEVPELPAATVAER
jgi:hypothetical protein